MIDLLREVFESIRMHPSRTVLTSLGIVWGMFILVLLVGVGKGFEGGVYNLFSGFSKGATYVISSETSIGYGNTATGAPVRFSEKDMTLLKESVPQITDISPEVSEWRTSYNKGQFGTFEVRGVHPEYFNIKLSEVSAGRLLNILDYNLSRKNAVIGENVAEILFQKTEPLGETFQIGYDYYKVVGIIKNNLFSAYESRVIYLPYSTFLQGNASAKDFTTVLFTTKSGKDYVSINQRVKSILSRKHRFSPNDEKVLYFNSMEEQVEAFSTFFEALKKLLWFLGISTLFSGIICVGNNMYTVTRERVGEIAIRKAVGATSNNIKTLFLCESIIVTSISGLFGIVLGWITLKIIGLFITENTLMMEQPAINLPTMLLALIVLIISGTVAGLRPALQASELTPIEALKENG